MTTPLNAMQLKMLEVYSEGDFSWLSVYSYEKVMEKAKSTDVGDLLLAFMLAELGDAETAEDAGDYMENASARLSSVAAAMDTLR